MNCIFCRIINKKQIADIVYEDEKFMAFKDINPSAPVHILLMPKKHISSINDLKEKHKNLMGELILLAKKIARKQNINKGYKLSFNIGKNGGQIVNHLHLHIMGGWK